jgi:hypothetical protein
VGENSRGSQEQENKTAEIYALGDNRLRLRRLCKTEDFLPASPKTNLMRRHLFILKSQVSYFPQQRFGAPKKQGPRFRGRVFRLPII